MDRARAAMLSVAEAQARALDLVAPLPAEPCAVAGALGRVLAEPAVARRDHPPFAASAMDGYAARWADLASLPVRLRLAGVSQAGQRFAGMLAPGTAVRILTGAPVPAGADTVVVQEDCRQDGDSVIITGRPEAAGGHIRPQALDARAGATLAAPGTRLGPAHLGLIAAADVSQVMVHRTPLVELVTIGDELRAPGTPLDADSIVSTNGLVLRALLERAGARVVGWDRIVPDVPEALAAVLAASRADLTVTIGGASVGDRDFVLPVLRELGADVAFWKIAMRPGKPLMMARLTGRCIAGLPGNPVSAFVCAQLFVLPMLRALQGESDPLPRLECGQWHHAMPAVGPRADYIRAALAPGSGPVLVSALSPQDSSMLSVLARADALAIREAGAPAAEPGAPVWFLRLD